MNEMKTEGRLLVSENKRLQDKLSERHLAFGQTEFDMHQRSNSYERRIRISIDEQIDVGRAMQYESTDRDDTT